MHQLQYPGLQLFTKSEHTSNARSRSLVESFESKSPSIKHATTINNYLSSSQNKHPNIWRNESFTLNDSSPTIVGDGSFGDSLSDNQNLTHFWYSVIQIVFSHVPQRNSSDFIEEINFNIIRLSDLNGLNRNISPLKPQKSVLDFPKRQRELMGGEFKNSKQTIFGRVIRQDLHTYLVKRTLRYNSIVIQCLMVIYKLKGLRGEIRRKSKRIVITVLILLYLAFQQTQFRIQYIRYNYMNKLVSLLNALNSLETLISQYHLHFKELHIDNIFINSNDAINSQHATNLNQKEVNIQHLHDIIELNADHLHFMFISLIKNKFPQCNGQIIEEYCKLFDISTFDLEFSLSHRVIDISEKIKSLQTLKKFWLCCLLATTRSRGLNNNRLVHSESMMIRTLSELLGVSPDDETFDFFSNINLHDFSHEIDDTLNTITSLTSLLLKNRYLLQDITPETNRTTEQNQQDLISECQLFSINQTIDKLREQLSELPINCSMSGDLSFDGQLRTVVSKLASTKDYLDRKLLSKPDNYHPTRSVKSGRRDISSASHSRGFALDVLRTPTLQTPTIDLKQEIEFTQIDNDDDYSSSDDRSNDYDTTFHLEQFIAATPNQRTVSVHYQSMKQLSDEQLQTQLTNEIMKFSAENKQSRENLRAEKSFELLKRCKNQSRKNYSKITKDGVLGAIQEDNCETGNVTNNSQQDDGDISKFGTEEGIPVLYNIEQFV